MDINGSWIALMFTFMKYLLIGLAAYTSVCEYSGSHPKRYLGGFCSFYLGGCA